MSEPPQNACKLYLIDVVHKTNQALILLNKLRQVCASEDRQAQAKFFAEAKQVLLENTDVLNTVLEDFIQLHKKLDYLSVVKEQIKPDTDIYPKNLLE
jgi:hypothetical protein